jgi:bifunctional non-homologous end joining protein LigD
MRPTEKSRLRSWPEKKADFVEPMECEIVSELREGSEWVYEVKLDGYRAIAVKFENKVSLFSRRRKSFNQQYPYIVEALSDLPTGTVIDGEIVALDDSGRPVFNLLQNYRRDAGRIRYFVFDLLCYQNRDTTRLPLVERRDLLRSLKFKSPRIQFVDYLETKAADIVAAVKEQGLEGVNAKRRDSLYQPGRRTGAWVKYRISQGQEFVIGGYFPGPHGFDSVIVGYYSGKDLMYVARTRNGFVPASRQSLFEKLRPLTAPDCPFVNLPETQPSRFGRELDAETMKKAVWLRPELVAQIDFLEWTGADRLRHSKFVRLREDKLAQDVVKEHGPDI